MPNVRTYERRTSAKTREPTEQIYEATFPEQHLLILVCVVLQDMFQRGSWTVEGAGSESAKIENKNKRLNLEQLLRFVVTTVSLLCPLSDI